MQCIICLDNIINDFTTGNCNKCNLTYHIECYKQFSKKLKMDCPICRKSTFDIFNYLSNIFSKICDLLESYLTHNNILIWFILALILLIPYLIISIIFITLYWIKYEFEIRTR